MKPKNFTKLTQEQRQAMRTKRDEAGESEVSEMWRAIKEQRAVKRGHNRDNSAKHLEELGIPFISHNCGAHLIIRWGGIWVDFWPGTGLFHAREPKEYQSRGVFGLVRYLEQHSWRTRLSLHQTPPPKAQLHNVTSPTGRTVTEVPQGPHQFPSKAVAALLKPVKQDPDDTPPWD